MKLINVRDMKREQLPVAKFDLEQKALASVLMNGFLFAVLYAVWVGLLQTPVPQSMPVLQSVVVSAAGIGAVAFGLMALLMPAACLKARQEVLIEMARVPVAGGHD